MKLTDNCPDEKFDYTVVHRYLESVSGSHITFEPSSSIYMFECKAYKFNWLLIWCISDVCTDSFVDSKDVESKNYFKLYNDDKTPQLFRTWSEGVRAGIQTLASAFGLKVEGTVVWPGTEKKKNTYQEVSDLDKLYGDGFSKKVLDLYAAILKFADSKVLPNPPVVGGPDQTPDPITPVPVPPATKPPVSSGSSSGWLAKVGAFLVGVGSLSFIIKLFLPGWAGQILDLLVQLGKWMIAKH